LTGVTLIVAELIIADGRILHSEGEKLSFTTVLQRMLYTVWSQSTKEN